MSTRLGRLLAAAGAAVLPIILVGAAENPVGQWAGATEVPGQGPNTVALTITKTDTGYAGSMTDSLGVVANESLREVTFADGVLTFGFSLADGVPMKMKLIVTDDKMAGEWQHPEGESGAITFERKKT